ncbi:hypothetical protein [Streptomyces sp. 8L]|uniref:hypothetical protein n=1 Tax=Streptomyces sp. 8L TaxID=2877242 RepID=UPI001CD24DC5|nr:hypothetical protein [Streptomyces sp. 8L]MCA1218854.1 hypothetical protein [Streptomyces sp. 8L]
MSATSRIPRSKRLTRRAENDALRTARRYALIVLLSRGERGVLSRDEGRLMRAHVTAEIAENDAGRASERGQQRAMERNRQRVGAAEQAIREAEQRATNAEDRLDAVRALLETEPEARPDSVEQTLYQAGRRDMAADVRRAIDTHEQEQHAS